jgi:nucleoside-diphosphate-sugar epimerase
MPRALITGGSGFIARYLTKVLKDSGVDVLSPTRSELDITARQSVKEYFPKNQFDYIFHLAAGATQGGHKGNFRGIFETNVTGTVNLLEFASNYKAFINVGSSSEYGSKKQFPMFEDNLPEPEFAYSGTKAASTMICQAMAKEYGLPIVTVRPFSVYGPGESLKRFIPTVIWNAIGGGKTQLARGVHDWTHVEDIALGMFRIAQKANELKGQVVNLGTGTQLTNHEVVDIISKHLGHKLDIEEVDLMRMWDDQKIWSNGSEKAKLLGIKFRSFEDGIDSVIEYIKEYNREIAI